MKKINQVMMGTAYKFASLSYAKRKKVGAVLSKNGRIIASGYNGTAPGEDNMCEIFCPECMKNNKISEDCHRCGGWGLITKPGVFHAEDNLLRFCEEEGIDTSDCDLHVTMAPCKACAGILISAKVKRVFYDEIYRDMSGVEALKQMNIETEQIKNELH